MHGLLVLLAAVPAAAQRPVVLPTPGGLLPLAPAPLAAPRLLSAPVLPSPALSAPLPALPEDGAWLLEDAYQESRGAVRAGDADAAVDAYERIERSLPYLDPQASELWMRRRKNKLRKLRGRIASALSRQVEVLLADSDPAGAKAFLDHVLARHPGWARKLEPVRALLPPESRRRTPLPPDLPPEGLLGEARRELAAGSFRQAEYYLQSIAERHPERARDWRGEIGAVRAGIVRGIYEAFQRRRAPDSPVEARRLKEYMQARRLGRSLGVEFRRPAAQDPESLMCTIYSLCHAIEGTVGFEDPGMDPGAFAALVQRLLGDPTIGVARGISTHRMRVLAGKLGLSFESVEMQERIRRPFTEDELRSRLRPDSAVLLVLIIANSYPGDGGIRTEEHKGFLSGAYFSESEGRWVYLVMDPLIGRVSFYTWPELRPFLHRLFVVGLLRRLPA